METIAEYREEGIRIGKAIREAREKAIGEHNQAVTIARRMIDIGYETPIIAKITGLEEDFIRSIVPRYLNL